MLETAAVFVFALMILAGGLMVALLRHVLHAIIGLGIALLGTAGIFLQLGSPFVAAMQVLIYIGGITVAMVFAMMLSEAMSRRGVHSPGKIAAATTASLFFLAALGTIICKSDFNENTAVSSEMYAVQEIGHGFLTTYNLVFEALSLVLLLAILGAILIAKKEQATRP